MKKKVVKFVEVEHKDLVPDCYYYDSYGADGLKLKFKSRNKNNIYFYKPKNCTRYTADLTEDIPFANPGSPWYRKITTYEEEFPNVLDCLTTNPMGIS